MTGLEGVVNTTVRNRSETIESKHLLRAAGSLLRSLGLVREAKKLFAILTVLNVFLSVNK